MTQYTLINDTLANIAHKTTPLPLDNNLSTVNRPHKYWQMLFKKYNHHNFNEILAAVLAKDPQVYKTILTMWVRACERNNEIIVPMHAYTKNTVLFTPPKNQWVITASRDIDRIYPYKKSENTCCLEVVENKYARRIVDRWIIDYMLPSYLPTSHRQQVMSHIPVEIFKPLFFKCAEKLPFSSELPSCNDEIAYQQLIDELKDTIIIKGNNIYFKIILEHAFAFALNCLNAATPDYIMPIFQITKYEGEWYQHSGFTGALEILFNYNMFSPTYVPSPFMYGHDSDSDHTYVIGKDEQKFEHMKKSHDESFTGVSFKHLKELYDGYRCNVDPSLPSFEDETGRIFGDHLPAFLNIIQTLPLNCYSNRCSYDTIVNTFDELIVLMSKFNPYWILEMYALSVPVPQRDMWEPYLGKHYPNKDYSYDVSSSEATQIWKQLIKVNRELPKVQLYRGRKLSLQGNNRFLGRDKLEHKV
jgi:hypothetical protein